MNQDEFDPEEAGGLGPRLVDPEAGPVIAALQRNPLLTVESDQDLFRLAVRHGDGIARWYDHTTGWKVDVRAADGLCRLYKRRHDPPADRAPLLVRADAQARRPAPPLVLTLLCLVCEQLWQHPETSFNDLQRAIAQTCATESEAARLPRFQPVSPDGSDRGRANVHRLALVDAIRLLETWGVVCTDRSLNAAEQDHNADLVITARRERLLALLACPSPTLLSIDLDRPDDHVDLLCSDQADLPEHASANQHDLRRRHLALRAVLDDPGVAPDTDAETGRYLASASGRRHALDAAAVAGLTCVVRRDWWVVADPVSSSNGPEFPHGRSHEQQAALLLLHDLARREDPAAEVTSAEAEQIMRGHLDRRPWWASRYQGKRGAERLAQAALTRLTEAGVLNSPDDAEKDWAPTPAVHVWKVSLAEDGERTTPDSDPDFADHEGDDDG